MRQRNSLTALVIVQAYETRSITESFFSVYEKNKLHFWEIPKPSLDIVQIVEIDTNDDTSLFLGQYTYSFSTQAVGLIDNVSIINNRKYLTCFFKDKRVFSKNDVVVSFDDTTKNFTNVFSFYVKAILSRLPQPSPNNPSLDFLEKSLQNYEYKRFEQFLGNARNHDRYLDVILLERDKKTQQRKTWYLQTEQQPQQLFDDINRNKPRFQLKTAKGNYVVDASSLKII